MIYIDEYTNTMRMAQGDTDTITLTLTDEQGDPLPSQLTGVGIFAICQLSATGQPSDIAWLVATITNNTVTFDVPNSMTRDVPAGSYRWDMRIVTDPEYDDDGNVIAEDASDQVHSIFAGTEAGMPLLELKGAAYRV